MLALLFHIGNKRYALDVAKIVEVLPCLVEDESTMTPDYFAGIINYRGKALPVIDLSQMHIGLACPRQLSSRIILVKCPPGRCHQKVIGLLASKVTETLRLDFPDSAPGLKDTSFYIETPQSEEREMIKWFSINDMLPDSINIIFSSEQ